MTKLALVFDTETTGIPDFRGPVSSPSQPAVTQLGYLLVEIGEDETLNREVASGCTLIKPDGWECTDKTVELTGITTEDCERFGVPLRVALQQFVHLLQRSDVLVAHNISFDQKMLMISSYRAIMEGVLGPWTRQRLGTIEKFCTAEACTPVMKLPSSDRGIAAGYPYRTPNLATAYQHFTGQKMVGAHDAMADTRACYEVYTGLKRWGRV